MKKHIYRSIAAVLALSLTAAALPVVQAGAETAEESKIIYETDFEDGDVSKFSKRGDTDTSVIGTATDDSAPSGSTVMTVTERSKGWNGPQIRLDEICEPGVKYMVSVKVKAAWYNNIMVSMQSTANGSTEPNYTNLGSAVSQGDWVSLENVSFTFSEDVHDVYIYIECSDGTELSIDDFCLKTAPVYAIEKDIPGLKDVYADYFKIGGAVTAEELAPASTKELILKHYNSLTLGNELKPENMLDQAACQAYAADGDNTKVGVTLGGAARSILNFCRDNDIPVRGHVLVWHSQTPGWFFKENYTKEGEWVDKETMLARMENYISGVMAILEKEYPDVDFYAWDVVNEAWLDDGSPRKGGMYDDDSNASGWTQVFGDNSFIPYAFEYARKYAPEGCKLYYNDFNEYMPGKTDAIVKMAAELKERDLIDGIGMQSHLDARSGSDAFPSVSAYKKALARFSETGLDVQITELDATVEGEKFEEQAQYYSDIMDAIVEYKDNVSAVVFWGTTDDMSWRASKSPLLFNADYTAKPSFYSIIDGIVYDQPSTEPTEPTDPSDEPTEPTPGTEVTMYGDVDCDGDVDIMDVILLNRSLMIGAEIEPQGVMNADVDSSDTVDAVDSLNILKAVVQLITLPVQ